MEYLIVCDQGDWEIGAKPMALVLRPSTIAVTEIDGPGDICFKVGDAMVCANYESSGIHLIFYDDFAPLLATQIAEEILNNLEQRNLKKGHITEL